ALSRFKHEHVAVRLLDLPADTARLLRKSGGCTQKRNGRGTDDSQHHIRLVHHDGPPDGCRPCRLSIRQITPLLKAYSTKCGAHFFLRRSASTKLRSSGVTSGRTPNHS